jgi:hypothetical protein
MGRYNQLIGRIGTFDECPEDSPDPLLRVYRKVGLRLFNRDDTSVRQNRHPGDQCPLLRTTTGVFDRTISYEQAYVSGLIEVGVWIGKMEWFPPKKIDDALTTRSSVPLWRIQRREKCAFDVPAVRRKRGFTRARLLSNVYIFELKSSFRRDAHESYLQRSAQVVRH